MPVPLLAEGPDLDVLIAEIQAKHGSAARIVRKDVVRRGGVGGFFAQQVHRVVYIVDESAAAPVAAAPIVAAPAPADTAAAASDSGAEVLGGLDDLIAAVEDVERRPVQQTARPAGPAAITNPQGEFAQILRLLQEQQNADIASDAEAVSPVAEPVVPAVQADSQPNATPEVAQEAAPVVKPVTFPVLTKDAVTAVAAAAPARPVEPAVDAAVETAESAPRKTAPRKASATRAAAAKPKSSKTTARKATATTTSTTTTSAKPTVARTTASKPAPAKTTPAKTTPAKATPAKATPAKTTARKASTTARTTPADKAAAESTSPKRPTPRRTPSRKATTPACPTAEAVNAVFEGAEAADAKARNERLDLLLDLRAIGVPMEINPDVHAASLYEAMDSLVQALPAAPALPRGAGEVIAVVGDLTAAATVVRRISETLRLTEAVLWFSGVDTHPAAVVCGADEFLTRRSANSVGQMRSLKDNLARLETPAIVLIATDSPDVDADDPWATEMLAALDPTHTIAVVDSTRKTADTQRWLDELGNVDALAIHSTRRTASPATVWELARPIALIDGRTASPAEWLTLLMPLMSRTRTHTHEHAHASE